MVSRHHFFNIFAKFHGLSTVINFAKANKSVCVDQNVERNSTSPHRMKQRFFIIQCSCLNEFTNLIKISQCWLNKIQAMQDHYFFAFSKSFCQEIGDKRKGYRLFNECEKAKPHLKSAQKSLEIAK